MRKIFLIALLCVVGSLAYAVDMGSSECMSEQMADPDIKQKSGFNKLKKMVKNADLKQKSGYNKAKKKVEELEGPHIQTLKGDTAFLSKKATACMVFDWSAAQWDNKRTAKEQWKEEYDKYVSEGEKFAKKGFSKYSRNITLDDNSNNATYIYNIKLTNFDYFFSVMSMVPGHKHKVWAMVTVTERATGKVVYQGEVKKFAGGRNFSYFDSFTECMEDFGKVVAKLK